MKFQLEANKPRLEYAQHRPPAVRCHSTRNSSPCIVQCTLIQLEVVALHHKQKGPSARPERFHKTAFLALNTTTSHTNYKRSRCTLASQTCSAISFGDGGALFHSGGGGGGGGGNWGGEGFGDNSGCNGRQISLIVYDEPREEEQVVAEHVVVLDIQGMKCGGCVSHLREILECQAFVVKAVVNLATETALVTVSSTAPGSPGADGFNLEAVAKQLAQVVVEAGFGSSVRSLRQSGMSQHIAAAASKRQQRLQHLQQITVDLVLSWTLASTCFVGHLAHLWKGAPLWLHAMHSARVSAVVSAAAMLGPGRHILTSGLSALLLGRPDMNSLVALGCTASYGVSVLAAALPKLGWRSFFEEPAMVLGFVLLGRALEARAKLQAEADMVALHQLLPAQAHLLLPDGSIATIPSDAVAPGDVLQVHPGERVPVDGLVTVGRTTVDESALTGEVMPVTKLKGSLVTAGSLNYDGLIKVEAQQSGEHTLIADIVRMVEYAQASSTPVQRLADDIAGKFAYGVMAASAITFVFWAGVGTRIFPQVLARVSAVSCCPPGAGAAAGAAARASRSARLLLSAQLACNVLVVACPCALGLATPTAVLVGTAAGARQGLLIRGGDVLEATSQVDVVAFDKTGTLTRGRPKVVGVTCWEAGCSKEWLLRLAATVEAGASHPVAKAVVTAAAELGATTSGASGSCIMQPGSFNQEPGSGVTGVVDGRHVAVGNLNWLMQTGASGPADRLAAPADTEGATRVYVAVDRVVIGAVDVADELRPDAAQTVADLRQHGIRTVLVSGDRRDAVLAVARRVGIPEADVFSEVKPAGKVAVVQQLQAEGGGHCVAMVGDGINDTAALAAANVGMAMAGGVDAASEVASVVLLRDQLHQVAEAVELSRKTVAKVHQNLCWAFGYNLIGIPIAAGALLPRLGWALTPSLSAAMMGGSSLMVMANALHLQMELQKPLQVSAG